MVTMRVVEDAVGLRRRDRYAAIVSCIRAVEDRGFRVVHFSVMNDHIHMIVEADDKDALSRGIQGLSVRLARAINRTIGRKGTVFADRYHARVLKTPRHVRWALRYVLLNARKHRILPRAGEATRNWVDPYSSACWFDGWSRRVRFPEGDPVPVEPPVRPPSTWLLRVGWRRRDGPLDPAEPPGRGR